MSRTRLLERVRRGWDPSLHPRWPGGAPQSRGGEFVDVPISGLSGMMDDPVSREQMEAAADLSRAALDILMPLLEREVGRRSNWSGVARVAEHMAALGTKEWNCAIGFSSALFTRMHPDKAQTWPVAHADALHTHIHEALHSISLEGVSDKLSFRDYRMFEEGLVDMLAHELAVDLLPEYRHEYAKINPDWNRPEWMDILASESDVKAVVFSRVDSGGYSNMVRYFRHAALLLGMTYKEFAVALISMPLNRRPERIAEMAIGRLDSGDISEEDFRTLFSISPRPQLTGTPMTGGFDRAIEFGRLVGNFPIRSGLEDYAFRLRGKGKLPEPDSGPLPTYAQEWWWDRFGTDDIPGGDGLLQEFNVDQPRWPKGSPRGGEWRAVLPDWWGTDGGKWKLSWDLREKFDSLARSNRMSVVFEPNGSDVTGIIGGVRFVPNMPNSTIIEPEWWGDLSPADLATMKRGRTRHLKYWDPEMGDLVGGQIVAKPGWLSRDEFEQEVGPKDPAFLWRGISSEEMASIKASGQVQSLGAYNMGEAQVGRTSYSEDPITAASYGSGFAPWHLQPSMQMPGYLIKIRRPKSALPNVTVPEEIESVEPTPASEIVDIWEVKPLTSTAGQMDLYLELDGTVRTSSGTTPSGDWRYRRAGVALIEFDPDQPRWPKGTPRGGQWQRFTGQLFDDDRFRWERPLASLRRRDQVIAEWKAIFANKDGDEASGEDLIDVPRVGSAVEKQLGQEMKDLLSHARVRTRMPIEVLEKVFDDGRFKTQFETGSSRGLLNNSARAAVENELFDYPPGMSAQARPVYGYVWSPSDDSDMNYDDSTSQYGDVVVFMKGDVRKRTTITFEDSLRIGIGDTLTEPVSASPLEDPHWTSLPSEWINSAEWNGLFDGSRDAFRHVFDEYADDSGYVEAQIHGGVSISDIERIEIDSDHMLPRWSTDGVYLDSDGQLARFERLLDRIHAMGIQVDIVEADDDPY